MKTVLVLVAALCLVGCGVGDLRYYYVHATATGEDLERAIYDCEVAVTQHKIWRRWDPVALGMVGSQMSYCLQVRHGWRVLPVRANTP